MLQSTGQIPDPMDQDPTANINSHHGSRRGLTAALVGVGALGVTMGGYSVLNGGGSPEAQLDTPARTIEALCAGDSYDTSEYRAEIGDVAAKPMQLLSPLAEIQEELSKTMPKNNFGLAASAVLLEYNQTPVDFIDVEQRIETTLATMSSDEAVRTDVCTDVMTAFLQKGERTALREGELFEVAPKYDANNVLITNDVAFESTGGTGFPVFWSETPDGSLAVGFSDEGRLFIDKNLGDAGAAEVDSTAPVTAPVSMEESTEDSAPKGESATDDETADDTSDDQKNGGKTDETGDDTGTGDGEGDDGNNGGSGLPGEGGTCNGEKPTKDCEGEDEGPGGPGGDETTTTTTPRTTTTTIHIPVGTTTTTTPTGHTTTTIPRTTTTTTAPTTTTTIVRPTTTSTTTTTTTIPRTTTTTTTTQPPTTTTEPKGEEPGPDCVNNPFDPRC